MGNFHDLVIQQLFGEFAVSDNSLLHRITIDSTIFGGKPTIRGRRLAVEHVLGMLSAGDSVETILAGYAWLERDDVRACLQYASRRF